MSQPIFAVIHARRAAGSRIAAVLHCIADRVAIVDSPQAAAALQPPPTLICAAARDYGKLLREFGQRPLPKLLLWSDEEEIRAFDIAAKSPAVLGLLGLRYPGGTPRNWELLLAGRRLTRGEPAPQTAPLSWGHSWFSGTPATPKDRDAAVNDLMHFAATLLNERRAGPIAELGHELLMNAMYDAPADDQGKALYAHDRKATIELDTKHRPTFGFGSDGARLTISVRDPFGRLQRNHLFSGLVRGLDKQGQMDTSGGGAGLGFSVMYRSVTSLVCDVCPQRWTQVTAVLDLDVGPRDLRSLPRSICFFG